MIHYDLRCGDGHAFDGWFKSSAAFDTQAQGGLIECPVCTGTSVTRALMTPRLSKGLAAPAEPAPAVEAKAPPGNAVAAPDAMAVGGAPALPDQVRAVLQRIRAEVEQKCDYVGPRFAEEARAMHSGDSKRRAIYGETTPDQAEALAEDGIEVARIPWVPRADG
jgi:hypothetical protein